MTTWRGSKIRFLKSQLTILKRIIKFGRHFGTHWKRALWANIASSTGSVCQLTLPVFGLWLIDKALPQGDLQLLLLLSIGMVLAVISSMIASFLEAVFGASFRESIALKLELDLFDHVQHLPISFFKEHNSGYIMSRITNDCQTAVGMLGNMAGLGKSIVFLVGGSLSLPLIHPSLGIIVLMSLPVHGVLLFWFNGRVKHKYTIVQERTALASQELFESLSGIAEIKVWGAEKTRKRQMGNKLISRARANISALILSKVAGQAAQTITVIISLIILIGGGYLVIGGNLTIGELVSMNAIAGFLLPSMNALVSQMMAAQKSIAALDRIDEILDIEPERKGNQIKKLPAISGKISFEKISFSYPRNPQLFRNLSMEIKPGERVLLQGSSGIGKTTLIHLLFGFYRLKEGRILIDDIPIDSMYIGHLRKQIALVSQDVFLFSDTIENNIKIADKNARREKIRWAAEMANALSFIEEFPDGFQTMTGERGTRLSGGQRQRIALARAFLADSPILVLDEATSAVDEVSEVLIHESIQRAMENRTTLIIAHHAGAICNSLDQIWRFENGEVERCKLLQENNLPVYVS